MKYRPVAHVWGMPVGVTWVYTENPQLEGVAPYNPTLPISPYAYGVINTSRELTEAERASCGLELLP